MGEQVQVQHVCTHAVDATWTASTTFASCTESSWAISDRLLIRLDSPGLHALFVNLPHLPITKAHWESQRGRPR